MSSRASFSRSMLLAVVSALALGVFAPSLFAQLDKATADAVESYFDFIDYNGGVIASQQIPPEDWKQMYVLDTRDADQFAREHIPGAVNIEWRQVFAQRAMLPKDRTIIAYCNTGSFSGQVAMALRLAGHENVRILYGGFTEWKARGGFEAYARAVRERK